MKIAIYQSKYSQILSEADDWTEAHNDYIRISEIVEVEIPMLSDSEQVEAKVKFIDDQIQDVRAELTARIEELTEQRQRLLAITYQEI